MNKEIKIYIIDDYFLIREGIKKIINELQHAVIVGESNDLSNLAAKVEASHPDIIIMELNLCDNPIRDLMAEIKTVSPQTKVLIVSDCICELPIITAIRSGIAGFIKKNVIEEELIMEILRYICKGRSNEQIAELLLISEKTVATHRKNIMKKAVVKKTSDLIIWALDNKIVQK